MVYCNESRPPSNTAGFEWLEQVALCADRTKALHLGLALYWLATRSGLPGVSLTRRTLARWSLSRDAAYDALKVLKSAGLVAVWTLPGRAHHVVLLRQGTDQPMIFDGYPRLV
jgi:hypothetical protein